MYLRRSLRVQNASYLPYLIPIFRTGLTGHELDRGKCPISKDYLSSFG